MTAADETKNAVLALVERVGNAVSSLNAWNRLIEALYKFGQLLRFLQLWVAGHTQGVPLLFVDSTALFDTHEASTEQEFHGASQTTVRQAVLDAVQAASSHIEQLNPSNASCLNPILEFVGNASLGTERYSTCTPSPELSSDIPSESLALVVANTSSLLADASAGLQALTDSFMSNESLAGALVNASNIVAQVNVALQTSSVDNIDPVEFVASSSENLSSVLTQTSAGLQSSLLHAYLPAAYDHGLHALDPTLMPPEASILPNRLSMPTRDTIDEWSLQAHALAGDAWSRASAAIIVAARDLQAGALSLMLQARAGLEPPEDTWTWAFLFKSLSVIALAAVVWVVVPLLYRSWMLRRLPRSAGRTAAHPPATLLQQCLAAVERWAPVWLMPTGGIPVLVVTDPAVVRCAVSAWEGHLPPIKLWHAGRSLMHLGSVRPAGMPEGADWASSSRLLAAAFQGEGLRGVLPQFVRATKAAIASLTAQGPGLVDAKQLAQRLCLDAMASLAVGAGFRATEFKVCDALQRLLDLQRLEQAPGATQEQKEQLLSSWQQLLSSHAAAAAGAPDRQDTLMGKLDPQWQPRGTAAGKDTTLAAVDAFLRAGFSATSSALASALTLLASHPEAEAQLASELDIQELLATPSRPSPWSPSLADLACMPFLGAVVLETLRLEPHLHGSTVRYTDREVKVLGLHVPERVAVWLCAPALHRSSRNFSKPDAFQPQRFLDPKSGARQAFFAFGAICPGHAMARLLLQTSLAMLLGNFRFTAVPTSGTSDTVMLNCSPRRLAAPTPYIKPMGKESSVVAEVLAVAGL